MIDIPKAMTERPIIFSGPMVRAIFARLKTQTRRVINAPALHRAIEPPSKITRSGDLWTFVWSGGRVVGRFTISCPYGQPGDVLWVRETWAKIWKQDGCLHDGMDDERQCPCGGCEVQYKADTGDKYPGHWPADMGDDPDCPKWRSPIHMPRWACRLLLEVKEVRVQKLQDISHEDCIAEGVEDDAWLEYEEWVSSVAVGVPHSRKTLKEHFADIWDSINAKRSPYKKILPSGVKQMRTAEEQRKQYPYAWNMNPWVWAETFERLEAKA